MTRLAAVLIVLSEPGADYRGSVEPVKHEQAKLHHAAGITLRSGTRDIQTFIRAQAVIEAY